MEFLFALDPLFFFACSMLQGHLTTPFVAAALPKEIVFPHALFEMKGVPLNRSAYKNFYTKNPGGNS